MPRASSKTAAVQQLGTAELAAWIAAGPDRIPVDLREPRAFAAGHLAGAVNLQAGYRQFALRAERFFPAESRLCLMSSDPQEARRLAVEAAGFAVAVAWLDVPVGELAQTELAWRTQRTIDPRDTAKLLAEKKALLIDARTADEYAAGHARGALFSYPDDFPRQASFLRRDGKLIVVCEAGWRSSLLVSWLDRAGFAHAYNLMGGMAAWRRAGLPLETGGEQKAFR